MIKIKHNIRTKKNLQTPIITCFSDEFFLLTLIFWSIFLILSPAVVILVGVLIKPAVDVQSYICIHIYPLMSLFWKIIFVFNWQSD